MELARDDLGFEAFCESATIALEREAGRLLNNAIDRLSSLECRWHPNGFAVFPISDDHELGSLRLHIWPDSSRITRPDDAPIHTHVWHLCSRILVGTYTETLYEKSGAESTESAEYYSATIDYLHDKDTVTASSTVFLKPVTTTQDRRGDFHTVPADVPHETHIAEGSFVATLMITSPPVSKKVTMYSPEEIQTSDYERPILAQDQKMELLGRLERELAIQVGRQN